MQKHHRVRFEKVEEVVENNREKDNNDDDPVIDELIDYHRQVNDTKNKD